MRKQGIDVEFETVAIVGVGLIGGSVGLALKKRGITRHVVGIGHRRSTLDKARRRGAVDTATTHIARGVAHADLVILASPVDLIAEHAAEGLSAYRPDAVVTDVGSVKGPIVTACERVLKDGPAFVGSHPLAGSHRRGIDAARVDLLDGSTVVVTPTKRTPADAVDRVAGLWQALGATVRRMSPAEHDRLVGAFSHLPHLVAAALVNSVPDDVCALAASGFLDTTRVAAGDARLWQGIFQQNRRNLLRSLDRFGQHLARMRRALECDDAPRVQQLLAKAKKVRDDLAR